MNPRLPYLCERFGIRMLRYDSCLAYKLWSDKVEEWAKSNPLRSYYGRRFALCGPCPGPIRVRPSTVSIYAKPMEELDIPEPVSEDMEVTVHIIQ